MPDDDIHQRQQFSGATQLSCLAGRLLQTRCLVCKTSRRWHNWKTTLDMASCCWQPESHHCMRPSLSGHNVRRNGSAEVHKTYLHPEYNFKHQFKHQTSNVKHQANGSKRLPERVGWQLSCKLINFTPSA